MPNDAVAPARYELQHGDDGACLVVKGDWRLRSGLPRATRLRDELDREKPVSVTFDLTKVEDWDSAILPLILTALRWAEDNQKRADRDALPNGVRRLIDLAMAVPEAASETEGSSTGAFAKVGYWTLTIRKNVDDWFAFIGRVSVAAGNLALGKTRLRLRDFFAIVEEVGARALPITALISFLIGLIIAFLGAVVLVEFNASYYVSYLVGYGMLREMGAVMTGIILAGRTGAAFAAKIGSMKVSEEIDALKVLGIDEVDYLVLPRIVALGLMMPLLVVFANIIGLMGGVLVSVTMLDMPLPMFRRGLLEAVSLTDLWLGLSKAFIFGVIVSVSGCIRGLQCGNTAGAVGDAATSAVVTGITLIVAANALIDWIAALYGI